MIPKRIFQTWKSKTDFPPEFIHWSSTFRDHNPDYEYVLWDDADNRKFIEDHYSWFLPTYDAFPAEIYRVDAVRYFWLYHFGGFYADMDVECIRNLDPILEVGSVVLGQMGTDPEFEHCVPNAIMASAPHEEFWLLCMALMMEVNKNQRPEYVTGPVLLRNALLLYRNRSKDSGVEQRLHKIRSLIPTYPRQSSLVTVLYSHLLYPLDWTDGVHELLRRQVVKDKQLVPKDVVAKMFPRSFTVTYWSHTWEPQP